ncbi:MAG: hypothetical protein WCS59_00535 [Sphaerochaetaceae bacterium]|nr:hypothetical protein [Sphaerochaetaceae bacterium]MDD4218585.1 hypothetical protein [Sphaerochaetaceae bacterium]
MNRSLPWPEILQSQCYKPEDRIHLQYGLKQIAVLLAFDSWAYKNRREKVATCILGA